MIISNRTNSNSISSLILGIFSIIIPFIGFILGVIGIVFSRKARKEIIITDENGLGLATIGLVFSVVGVIIQLWVILSFILFATLTGP